ncbi:MAG: aminotransferase class III-fold pyridoxal phosphate-dependent enzyme [Anaerolineae bacterium]|nr:aminotransferase class III-fold pyridoxal phosphate-dependent enzyme [Anaerolineae bacterium]
MDDGANRSRLAKGEALYERALRVIPGGGQTNSKMPPPNLKGAYPPYILRGQGAYVWDLDGNRYIDHKLGCGPVTLGHAYPRVIEAAARQMGEGLVYGSAHPLEVELAELLTEVIPCAEMARFLKSGAEGTSAAVRVARTYTGRDLVLSCGYHGWHDWSMAKHARLKGIPECVKALTVDVPYGDREKLADLFATRGDQVAAFVFAAPYHEEPDSIREYLRHVRELVDRHGAVLIFDEIVTGFRVSLGGLQELIGVTPDLAVFSKGMANGFPIAAVVGRREVMTAWNDTTISSTFGGETASIAASIAAISEAREKDTTGAIAERGAWLKARAVRMGEEVGLEVRALGFDALPNIVFGQGTAEMGVTLQRELLLHGVFPYFPIWYISYSHDMEVMQETAAALRVSLERVAEAAEARER